MMKNTKCRNHSNCIVTVPFSRRHAPRAAAVMAAAIGAMLASRPAMANGPAEYFDANGSIAGFGSPTIAGNYDEGGTYWTTDSTGQTGQTAFPNNNIQLTFGVTGSDLAGDTFSVNMDTAQFTGIVVNSTSANITLTGSANAYLQNAQNWTVAAGSTLTEAQAWNGVSLNYNGASVSLNGAGTINLVSPVGYNSGATMIENGTGIVNLQSNSANGVTNSFFTLTSGTLNFATADSGNEFNQFSSGHIFEIDGGTIDNTTGSPLTLSVGTGSYTIGGSFTFTGSSSLNLGTQGVALTVSPTITTVANTLTIGGIAGTTNGITKAGAGTLVLSGTNGYTGATNISGGTLQIGIGGTTGSLSTSSTITNNGTLAIDRSDNVAQGGIFTATAIGGTGGITQLGGGTLTLTASNTYSGPTTIMAGTLQAGIASVANTSGAFGNNSAVSLANISGATLDLNGFNTQIGSLTGGGTTGGNVTLEAATLTVGGNNLSAPAYAGVISSSGSPVTSLIKIGSGNLTLSGINTYTGATNVSAGTLIATNASALGNGSAVSVAQGAALNYVATANSPLTIGSLALTGGAGTTLGGSIGSTITGAEILSSGAVTGSGAVAVNIYGIPGVSPAAGTNAYTLITAPSGLDGPTFSLGTVYNATNFTVGSFTSSATALQVGITAVSSSPSVYWYGGFSGAPGVWAASDGSANSNWSSAASFTPTSLTPGSGTTVNLSVTSGATVTNQSSMTLGAAVSILGLVQNDSTAFTLLNDANGDALTIGTGGVSLNSGAGGATLSAPIILGGAQTWTNSSSNALTISNSVANGGFLLTTSTTSGGITLSSGLTGTGGLTVGGTGITTLAGTNNYSGATTVNANATLSLTGTVGSGGGTAITSSGNFTESSTGIIAGTSSLTISGGTTRLAGANAYTGATAINGGVLNIQNAGALLGTSSVSVATNAALQIQGGISTTVATPLTLNGSGPSGNGALESIGSSGINTYTGPITLGSATTISSDSAGGTLALTNTGTITGSGVALTLTGAGTGVVDEVIGTGSGSVTKSGTGTWILASGNTYTGTTTVSQGTLVAENSSPRSTNIVIAGGATLEYVGGSNAAATTFTGSGTLLKTGPGTLSIGSGGTMYFNFSPGAIIDIEGGAMQDSSFNAQWGGNFASLDINTGAAAVINANNWIVDGLNNGASGGGTFTSTYDAGQSLTVGIANGNGSFGGTITNNPGNALTLIKAGTGTQILSGVNSYTGPTSVNAGTLALISGGSLGATAVTVSSGATLAVKPAVSGANNTIGGSLTLNPGSTFSMADGVASTTTVAGAATLNGTNLIFDLGGTSSTASDVLTIGGTATLGGTVNTITLNAFGSAGSGLLNGAVFPLISDTGAGLGTSFSLTNNRVVIAGNSYTATLGNTGTIEQVTLTLNGASAAYYTGNAGVTTLNATSGATTNFSSDPGGSSDFSLLGLGAPGSAQDVYFTATSGTGTTGPQTTSLGQAYTFASLNFTSGSPAITISDTFGLTVISGITDAGANNQVLGVPVTLGLAQTITNSGAGNLSFTAGVTAANSVTIAGSGTVTIAGTAPFVPSAGFTVNSGAGAFTVNSPVTLGAVQTWINNSNNAVNVGGTVTNGGFTLTTAGTGNIVIAAISGTGGLTAAGTGTTTLSGSSNYTGATTINSGAALSLTGTIGSGTGTAITSSGTFNQSGAGIITGGSTVIVNAGTTTLGGVNNYSGVTTLTGGTLNINNNSALGSNYVAVTGNAAIDNTSGSSVSVSNVFNINNATLTFNGSNPLTLTNDVNLIGGTATISVGGSSALTIGGILNDQNYTNSGATTGLPVGPYGYGASAFTKSGTGTLTINGTSAFFGGKNFYLTAGTLNVNSSTALADYSGFGTNALNISAGTTLDNTSGATITIPNSSSGLGTENWNGNFTFGGTNPLTMQAAVNLGGSITVTVNGSALVTQTGGVAGSGDTLTIAGPGNFTESGAIATTTGSVIMNGTGTLTLSGADSYTGATTVNAGTLTATGASAFGGAGPLAVNNPNTGAGTAVVLNLSTTAGTSVGSLSGTIATPSGGTNTATINNGGQPLTVTQTTNASYAGVIAGTGSFTLGGSSTKTLTLSGANTYTGATNVNAATLALGSGGSLGNTAITVSGSATFAAAAGTSAGTSTLNVGATLSLASGATLSLADGTIGTFALNQGAGYSGGAALTLAGANTFALDIGNPASTDELVAPSAVFNVAGGKNLISLVRTTTGAPGGNGVNWNTFPVGTTFVIADIGTITANGTVIDASSLAASNSADQAAIATVFSVTDNMPSGSEVWTPSVVSDGGTGVDLDVTVASTPEPGSLGLLGFAALGLLRRRRRSNRIGG